MMLLYTVFRVFPPKHLFNSICNSGPTPVLQWRLWYLCRKLIGRDESRSQWSEIIVFEGASHLWFFAVLCMKCMHTHIPTSSKGWSHIAFLHTHTHTHTYAYVKGEGKGNTLQYFCLENSMDIILILLYFLLSERFFKFCSTLKFSSFIHMTSYIPIITPPSPTTQYCILLIPSPHW